MRKRVVITGPTGAVGMALIQACAEKEAEVLAICHKGSERTADIPQSPLVTVLPADLSELGSLEPQGERTYDVFYHLAWMGTTGDARNDLKLQCKNMEYTIDAAELAARLGCHTFIGAGSQAEYGRVEGALTPETPVFPENAYGVAKLGAGQMSRLQCEKLGLKHIWARILSVYGPFDGENTMISSAVRKLLEGQRASFTPGEQLWDYLYSKDAAEALWRLGDTGVSGKTYVLGSGEKKPLKEYIMELYQAVKEVEENAGTLGIGDYEYAKNQVMCLWADISELTKDTGFCPGTSFAEGIRKTVESFRGR